MSKYPLALGLCLILSGNLLALDGKEECLNIFSLPKELVHTILEYLSFSDLIHFSLVNKETIDWLIFIGIKKDVKVYNYFRFKKLMNNNSKYLSLINELELYHTHASLDDLENFTNNNNVKLSIILHKNTESLSSNSNIKDILVYDNNKILRFVTRIGIVTAQELFQLRLLSFIARNSKLFSSLRELNISDRYGPQSFISKYQVRELIKAADCLNNLKKLYLGSLKKEIDMELIIELFKNFTGLHSLTLENQFIRGARGLDITPALGKIAAISPMLSCLRIDFCGTINFGFLSHYNNLKTIELRYLDETSIKEFASASKELNALNELTLHKCDLRNSYDLVTLINNLSSVDKLYLKSSDISIDDMLIECLVKIKILGIYELVSNVIISHKNKLTNLRKLNIYHRGHRPDNLDIPGITYVPYLDPFSNL